MWQTRKPQERPQTSEIHFYSDGKNLIKTFSFFSFPLKQKFTFFAVANIGAINQKKHNYY